VIMFRDGVSEGQYAAVHEHEIKGLKDAFAQIDPMWQPKVTWLICGKRHHTRFFATNQQDTDKTGNLPAGTVVDRQVVHPFAFEFYIQSQAGLVGTARPCHYTVLSNESQYSADELQKIVHSLSFTYARATRSVSLPPPCYYADVLLTQCRPMVYGGDDTFTETSGSGGTTTDLDPLKIQNRLKGAGLESILWFM